MTEPIKPENLLASKVIAASYEVQKEVGGPGVWESIYEESLCIELGLRGIQSQRQKHVPAYYKGVQLGTPYKLDLLVGDLLVVECKAAEKYNPNWKTQTLTYLRVSKLKLGLIINFGEPNLADGIYRVVNGL